MVKDLVSSAYGWRDLNLPNRRVIDNNNYIDKYSYTYTIYVLKFKTLAMKNLTESLKKVEQDLAYFVSRENKDGFICDESIFKDYTLEDFKKLAEID